MSNPQLMPRSLKRYARPFSRLASIFILALAMAGTAPAQVAPPVGPYGFVLNAALSESAQPQAGAAILGLMTFDGAGNVSGPYTLELGGRPDVTGTFTGTYSSNPDGTGTISVALDAGVYLTLAMVIDNRGRGLELVAIGCTGPICNLTETVISGVAEIEFNGDVHPVGLGHLNGSYGLQFTRTVPAPFSALSVWTFDGTGNVTMLDSFVGPGPITGSETRTGTYTINPDGTGTITLTPQPGLNIRTYAFVIAQGRSGLLVLQTNRRGDGVFYAIGRLQKRS